MQCRSVDYHTQTRPEAWKLRIDGLTDGLLTNGTLYVVATPIGNLDDLSPRARDTLRDVDVIASEDTRRTGRLLSHFGIAATQLSLHEHNEERAAARIVGLLRDGRTVALVSDAGTPLVSDPGFSLLRMAHAEGLPVTPIPGPSALIAALSVAGLATDRFCFEGFLPARAAARRTRLQALRRESRTLVLYESVHRIRDTIGDAALAFGSARRAFIGRELSKLHEQCVQATLGELAGMLDDRRIVAKGEFVLVIEGGDDDEDAGTPLDVDLLLRELAAALPGSQAVDIAATVSGRRRNDLYRRMLELGGND
jgi:16S rRNA (cytidine1402-2'-O)-methyltransferase